MKPAYTWSDLPKITVLTAPILGLAWQGAIRVREKHVINFVLYPDRLFAVIGAQPDAPDCAVQALGRMIFIHHGGTELQASYPGDASGARPLPFAAYHEKSQIRIVRQWTIGSGITSARLNILDDEVMPMAEVQFWGWTTEKLLWQLAATVLQHRASLAEAEEDAPM